VAHAEDDRKARARLDQIHREIATLTSALEGYGAAIVQQQSRVALARDAEAQAARRPRAAEALVLADRLEELGQFAGDAVMASISRLTLYQEIADAIHREYGYGA
jgi:multidrug resistance efflux pump